ncbi:MAG TPA: sporulation protein YqfD [Candidatus Pullichristensenella avicola]|nr:sporulation protein YqfD [Candidatus Pullichristensenella avicola]
MIRLRVEGLRLERLLERALAEGASFSRVERDGARAMILETGARGARVVGKLCARHSLRLETVCVTGADALARFCRRRWTLLPGLLLGAALLFLYTQRIWIVDVAILGDRAAAFDAAQVRAMLTQMDVHPGMAAADVDVEGIELSLSAASEEFSFVGARIQGVRLLVEVAPSLQAPEVYDLNSARDLVAACDGVVVSVNVQSGVAAVQPGDIVRRGEVLIRGEERASAEETRGVAARGEVVARAWVEASAEAECTRVERVYTGRTRTGSALRFLRWSWPLSPAEPFSQCEAREEFLPVGGLFLPLMIERVTYAEYAQKRVRVDETALKTELSERAFATAGEEIAQIDDGTLQVVDKWIDYSMIEGGRLRANAIVEIHRNIATTREALAQGG